MYTSILANIVCLRTTLNKAFLSYLILFYLIHDVKWSSCALKSPTILFSPACSLYKENYPAKLHIITGTVRGEYTSDRSIPIIKGQ